MEITSDENLNDLSLVAIQKAINNLHNILLYSLVTIFTWLDLR